jgi:hypothetical protein
LVALANFVLATAKLWSSLRAAFAKISSLALVSARLAPQINDETAKPDIKRLRKVNSLQLTIQKVRESIGQWNMACPADRKQSPVSPFIAKAY